MGGLPSVGGARRVVSKIVAFGQHVGVVPLDYQHRIKHRGQEPLPRYRRPRGRAPRRDPLPVRRAARPPRRVGLGLQRWHGFDNQRAALHPQWVGGRRAEGADGLKDGSFGERKVRCRWGRERAWATAIHRKAQSLSLIRVPGHKGGDVN
jgi:hypothetical protein